MKQLTSGTVFILRSFGFPMFQSFYVCICCQPANHLAKPRLPKWYLSLKTAEYANSSHNNWCFVFVYIISLHSVSRINICFVNELHQKNVFRIKWQKLPHVSHSFTAVWFFYVCIFIIISCFEVWCEYIVTVFLYIRKWWSQLVAHGTVTHCVLWWPGIVVSMLASISEVNLHRAQLVLRWATVPGLVPGARHLFRYVTNQPPSANSASIPPGSVNEYQFWLGRHRQVWFIPLADECWVCR